MIRGVLKVHADTSEVSRARPVLAGHLRRIKHYLPGMEGSAARREYVGELWNGYALLLLMLQGVFRKGDLREIDLRLITKHRMKIQQRYVDYYLIKLQDKPRKGTSDWRYVVIVKRDDDLDSYEFIQQRLRERSSGGLFESGQRVVNLVDKIIRWAKKNVPKMQWMTAHGLRSGGYYELRQVAPNNENVKFMQGGWGNHLQGREIAGQVASAANKYLRRDKEFVAALLRAGQRDAV